MGVIYFHLTNLGFIPDVISDFRDTKLPLIILIKLTKCASPFLILPESEGIQGGGLVWAALHTNLGSGAAEHCAQRQALSGVMEEDIGPASHIIRCHPLVLTTTTHLSS